MYQQVMLSLPGVFFLNKAFVWDAAAREEWQSRGRWTVIVNRTSKVHRQRRNARGYIEYFAPSGGENKSLSFSL
jgi:hypothetical protein